jgi:predicted O-methyltransferase YrrM
MNNMPPGLELFEPMNRWTLLALAINSARNSGDFAEFGVFQGKSAKHILRWMPADRKLYLFDSFYGLPEHWHWDGAKGMRAGHFNMHGKAPDLGDKRVEIVKGLFEDTVAEWAEGKQPLAFIHIDSDLYSSCKTVLTGIKHLIVPGTIIQFDEIQGYRTWEQDEYKAWMEAGFDFEWLGRSAKFRAALKVK